MTRHRAAPRQRAFPSPPSDGLGPERGEATQADDSGSHRHIGPPTRHIHIYLLPLTTSTKNVLAVDLYEQETSGIGHLRSSQTPCVDSIHLDETENAREDAFIYAGGRANEHR
jgi:hypothetical protein